MPTLARQHEIGGGRARAPDARIAVYFAPNTDQGFVDAITQAVHGEGRVLWTRNATRDGQQREIVDPVTYARIGLGLGAGDQNSVSRIGDVLGQPNRWADRADDAVTVGLIDLREWRGYPPLISAAGVVRSHRLRRHANLRPSGA
jgi:hypothetical protein